MEESFQQPLGKYFSKLIFSIKGAHEILCLGNLYGVHLQLHAKSSDERSPNLQSLLLGMLHLKSLLELTEDMQVLPENFSIHTCTALRCTSSPRAYPLHLHHI